MGICDLWLALSPASQSRTLTQVAVTEGFEYQRHRDRCLIIGVDASIWMNEAQMAVKFRPGQGTRSGENPALRILFYRLCRLMTLPIIPVFVFDGPDRPSVKRGAQVKRKPHWLSSPLKKLIEAFGFFWYMAPGEAEADLAELNRRGFVDAIFSEDNDNFVFGACCVIRTSNVKDAGDQVNIFNSESIRTDVRVLLTREGLFLMAILCGGDYDNGVGLEGCGWKTARLLAQSKLATSLFIAASTLSSREKLREFLRGWRDEFRTLLVHDPQNVLGRKYPSLAKKITNSFPSVDLILQYAQPLTSWTTDQIPDTTSWHLRRPRLAEIATLCKKYFSWASLGDIVSRFKATLWPGIAIQYILQLPDSDTRLAYYTNNAVVPGGLANIHVLRICQARLGPGARSTHPDVSGYTIQISMHDILRETALELDSASRSLIEKSDCIKISFWIPASILGSALPDLIKRFKGQKVVAPIATYTPVLTSSKPQQLKLSPRRIQKPTNNGASSSFDSGNSLADPIVIDNEDKDNTIIVDEGSSTGMGLRPVFLGHINLCTPSPPPS
ncbi:PIN domain-like protein [Crassisporium funariophilum]|nr:PIN domain-like protein [Crassisporium funariophilum]